MKHLKNQDFLSKIILIYASLLVSLFLFYFHDGYYDLTVSKYQCFLFLTYGTLGILLISCLFLKQNITFRSFFPSSICDWAILVMCAGHVITTLGSPYPYESLFGTYGRSCGLLFSFTLLLMYFMVSRYLHSFHTIIMIFLVSGMIIIGLGIFQICGIDPLGFLSMLDRSIAHRYLSSTGNVTFFAHLICFFLPIACSLYQRCDNIRLRLFYAACVCFGFIGLFISSMDGAYLAIAAFLLFHGYQSCKNYRELLRFLEILIFASFSAALLWFCSQRIDMRPFYGFSLVLYSWFPVICLSILLAIYFHIYKHPYLELIYLNLRSYGWLLIGVCVLGCFASFLYFSFIDTTYELGEWTNYLRFNDAWGSRRGFAWNSLCSLYLHEFTFFQKLFGYGLDSVRILMVQMVAVQDSFAFDNAHNEYLQYLVTSGLFGLIAYLVFYVGAIIRLFHKKNDKTMMILGILIAHGVYAFTGINQPITTPLLFFFIAMGEHTPKIPTTKL